MGWVWLMFAGVYTGFTWWVSRKAFHGGGFGPWLIAVLCGWNTFLFLLLSLAEFGLGWG